MPSKKFVIDLSKLMIAAAWADNELDDDEIDALKDLLFTLPELSVKDWTVLEMYIDSPVSKKEADRLLQNVLDHIRSEGDKQFVISAFTRMVEADGVITDKEKEFLEQLKEAIDGKKTGLFSHFTRIIGGAVKNRTDAYDSGVQREERIDDYLKNAIYFQLVTELESSGKHIDLPDEQVRKLCLTAGLLARVSWVDEHIAESEIETIQEIIAETWDLSEDEAHLITKISVSRVAQGLDYYRLTRRYYERTTVGERKVFLETLFRIANSSGKTSHKEIEDIRTIAEHLHLAHSDFIDAKLSVSDKDRRGL